MNATIHPDKYWETPADDATRRVWCAEHFTLSPNPGQSCNPHRVHWTDYVEQARLMAEAQAYAAERRYVEPEKKEKAWGQGKQRPVIVRDLQSGEWTRYTSAMAASKILCSHINKISQAITAGRFIVDARYRVWYADLPEPDAKPRERIKPVTLQNLETGEIVTMPSTSAMARYIGAKVKTLQAYIPRGKGQIRGWALPGAVVKSHKIRQVRPLYTIDIVTLECHDYPNILQASRATFDNDFSIQNLINGKIKSPMQKTHAVFYADSSAVIYDPRLDKKGDDNVR